MTKKRIRSDSTTAQVKAFTAVAQGEIKPPAHVKLRAGDWPFWASIVEVRARASWNAADLENAANLARCKADIERLTAEIGEEGDTVINARGTQIVNPKHTLLETLSRRAMSLSRMLHVHAEATQGASREEEKRKAVENEAAAALADGDEALIAQPMH